MTPAARLAASIEVLQLIASQHRPAAEALKDWGRSHRFAGSGDRAAIGNLVYDVQRRKGSLAWLMQSEEPRAVVLALYAKFWANVDALEALCTGSDHAPAPLSDSERANLARGFDDAPAYVRGFYPEWLEERFAGIYGDERMEQGAALAQRAPVDLRVNTLKAAREKVLAQLSKHNPQPCRFSPQGVRVELGQGASRSPHIEAEGVYQRGHIEVQDEASQLASLLSGAHDREQIADICAGGGGKTLALAALMNNSGQIIASDSNKHRLAPIYERLKRAGARNVQVKQPDDLKDLAGRMDRVVLDVPCTGTGAWRRKPDAKWRLKEQNIADRQKEQDDILARGAELVRPGGELVYLTCSVLKDENEHRVAAFLASAVGQGFVEVDMKQQWVDLLGGEPPPQPEKASRYSSLRLSPHSSGTDGFFIARLKKRQ